MAGCGCRDKKISVRFCPSCNSFKVKYVQGLSNLLGLIPKQKCLDCGFEATTFPVLVTTESELKKAVEKMKAKKKAVKKKISKAKVKKVVKKVAGRKKK